MPMKRKFRLLTPPEIKCLVTRAKADIDNQSYWCSIALYADTRTIYDILDDTVGPENWMVEHYQVKNKDFAKISIWDDKKNQWISKSDCGSETFIEKEKGESSDAVKRAAVAWGLTRELYLNTELFVELCADDFRKDDGGEFRLRNSVRNEFSVTDVVFDGGKIKRLSIKRNEKIYVKDLDASMEKDDAKKLDEVQDDKLPAEQEEMKKETEEVSEEQKKKDLLEKLEKLDIKPEMILKKYGIKSMDLVPVSILEDALKTATERALKMALINELKKKLKITSDELAKRLNVAKIADASSELLANYLKDLSQD